MDSFDQFSIFEEPERDAFLEIEPQFYEILSQNGLPGDSRLTGEMRKGYYSVLFDQSVIFRIYNKKRPYITVPEYTLINSNYLAMNSGKKDNYVKFNLSSLKNIKEYSDLLNHVLQEVLDSTPHDFDCCSRFEKCSDALKCIHPDKAFSFKCGYRKILKSGRVFYGKNRNIDQTAPPGRLTLDN